MESEVFNKFKNILIEKFNVEENKIQMTADLVNDLGIDSFGAIELKYELENKFKLKIGNNDLAPPVTIGDIIKFLESKKTKT